MTFAILAGIGEAVATIVPEITAATAAAGETAAAAATAAAPELATTGSFIGDAAAMGLGGTAETAVGTGSTLSGLASGVGGGAAGEAGLGTALGISGGSAGLGGLGSFAAQQLGGQAISQGAQGIQNAQIASQNKQAQEAGAMQEAQQTQDAKALGSQVYGLAGGGEVALEDGQFILPADVVSALGNGSTKAGAKFLDEFFGLA